MRIIIRPIITEKITAESEKFNRYCIIVDPKANKLQIAEAVKEMYGVTVERVNTMNYAGKKKSRYTKAGVISGKTNAFKKAVVEVAEGESIDFYSNI